jgi:predicted double-glycine peptidase
MRILIIFILLTSILFGYSKTIETKLIYHKSNLTWLDLRNKDLVSQKFDYSCGSASLSTIFTYFYKKNISESDVLDTILDGNNTIQDDGKNVLFSFFDLARVAIKKDFKSFSLELDFQTLKKLKIPAILYVIIRKEPHFTVFKAIDKNHIYLADPSFGNIKMPLEKFKDIFNTNDKKGKILLVIPKNKEVLNYAFMKVKKQDKSILNSYMNNKILLNEIRALR